MSYRTKNREKNGFLPFTTEPDFADPPVNYYLRGVPQVILLTPFSLKIIASVRMLALFSVTPTGFEPVIS